MENNNKINIKAILIMLIGCVFLFIVKGLPLLYGLILSFKRYSMPGGILGSPWVGFLNYTQVLQDFSAMGALQNTLRLNVLSLLLAALITGVSVAALSTVKNNILKALYACIFSVPFFIPLIAYIGGIFPLSVDTLPYFGSYAVFISALKMSSVAILLSMLFIWSGRLKGSGIKKAMIGALVVLLFVGSRILSSDMSSMLLLVNPLNMEHMSTLDSYIYRSGFMMARISSGEAAWVLKYGIELFFTMLAVAFGYMVLEAMEKRSSNNDAVEQGKVQSTVGMVVCNILALLILALLILCFIPSGGETAPVIGGSVVTGVLYFILVLITAMTVSALAAILAYPLTVKHMGLRIIYSIVIALSLYAGTLSMHQFLLFRHSGLFNTLLAVLFSDFLPVILIFVLALAYAALRDIPMYRDKSYSAIIIRPTIATAAFVFAAKWGSYVPSMLYVTGINNATPALQYYQMLTNGGVVSPLQTAVIVAPSLLVLAAAAVIIIPCKKLK